MWRLWMYFGKSFSYLTPDMLEIISKTIDFNHQQLFMTYPPHPPQPPQYYIFSQSINIERKNIIIDMRV